MSTRIASFDIGKVNFAFCIEEFDKECLMKVKNPAKGCRYNPNGTPTDFMSKTLNEVCNNGKIILFKNSDLTERCVKGSYLDPETFHNMIDLLDQYKDLWETCDAFVIEQQMAFRGKRNPMAVKLGQHCYSYFCFNYGRFKSYIEFPAYHKTEVLGSEKIKGKKTKNGWKWKNIDKPARKKWSIKKAQELLDKRGEGNMLSILKTTKKKDDLADVFCQLQAFKYLCYVDRSI
jgi:hypothetical protein